MNTKNIFRTLFMAVLLLVGANSAKADEIVVWEGSASDGKITVDKNKFQNVGENTKICLYFSGGEWGFAFCVAINNRHDESNYTNWEGWSYNDTNQGGQQNTWTGKANTPVGDHFELILSETGADEIKKGGLEINSINQITFTKITFVTAGTSPASPTYNISVNTPSNGTVTANPTKAKEGATVTLTINPNAGYELETISATDGDNQAVTLNGSGNTRTFTMPASDVTVSATFKASVYTVSVSSVSNGSIAANTTSATMGETVTLTITPDSRYELGSISVVDGSGQTVTLSGSGNTRTFTMPANNVTVTGSFVKERTYVSASISSTGYATFCSEEALDFSSVTNLKAYYASAVSDTEVTFKLVTGTVAAGTGLLLVGETAQVLVAESGTSYDGNLLVGVLGSAQTVNSADKYVLVARTDSEVGVKFADTAAQAATVPAGKAYLQAPSNSRLISFSFDDGTTGINVLTTAENQPSSIYNLQGQRVTTPGKGLYIINGKKVIIK